MNTALQPNPRVALVVGSVREGRFGTRVAAWVQKHLLDTGVDADVIDLAEFSFLRTMNAHPDVADFATRIEQADAVVVITPEYNHGYPGPLKTAIDALRDPWRAKAVAFVSYGAMSGGLRAVEALRLVFAELHAVTVRDTVSLHHPWQRIDDPDDEYPDHAATEALRRMMRQLLWWADALRAARHHVAYPA